MGILNRIGGALLLAGLAVAVIIGFQTPTGRRFWDGIWQAGASVVDFFRGQSGRLGISGVQGNALAAVGAAAILFLLLIMFVPGVRQGRAFVICAVLFTALGFILYNPSIVR